MLIKVAGSKNVFIHTCFFRFAKNLSNFVRDFWEDSFPTLKLLLAANRLIYLNITIDICQKFTTPGPLGRHTFLHRTNYPWSKN